MRWIKKNWIPLLTSLIALGALSVSIYALQRDSAHFQELKELQEKRYEELDKQYEELTKPHTKHDEIYNRLVVLDGKIERTTQNISNLIDVYQDISEYENNLWKAKELRNQAELAWDAGVYSEADKFISQTHDLLNKIPSPPLPIPAPPTPIPPANWWLMAGIAVAVIVVAGIVVWLVAFERREDK